MRLRGVVRHEAQAVTVLTQLPDGLGATSDRLAGDMENSVDVEQNGRHRRRVYSGHPDSDDPRFGDRTALLAVERIGRPTCAEDRDARRGELRRRGFDGAHGNPEGARGTPGGTGDP